jgi:FkbM family methyltransferase
MNTPSTTPAQPRRSKSRLRKRSSFDYAKSIVTSVVKHPSNDGRRVRALARAVGWQLYKRVYRRPLDIRYAGLHLRCHPDSNSASNVIYYGVKYDFDEMTFMQRYLRPGDGYIDVGANIGTYTLLAASLVGPTGHIDSFEPLPLAAARLRENIRLNDLHNVTVHEAAISDRSGTVEFMTDFDVSNSVWTDRHRPSDVVEVCSARLDDELSDAHFTLGKVDIEGLELAAFRGADQRLLAADPPVWQVEVMDHQLTKFGASADLLVTYLFDHGFELAYFDARNGQIRFEPERRKDAWNVFAIARSRRDEVYARLTSLDT